MVTNNVEKLLKCFATILNDDDIDRYIKYSIMDALKIEGSEKSLKILMKYVQSKKLYLSTEIYAVKTRAIKVIGEIGKDFCPPPVYSKLFYK